jgi:hypothetical protein
MKESARSKGQPAVRPIAAGRNKMEKDRIKSEKVYGRSDKHEGTEGINGTIKVYIIKIGEDYIEKRSE